MAKSIKKTTKTVARKSLLKTGAKKVSKAKASARTRVSSAERIEKDKKVIAALRKGVTTAKFRDELKLLTSGSMLSNLNPVAKRAGLKIKQDGTKGKYVYKFVGK